MGTTPEMQALMVTPGTQDGITLADIDEPVHAQGTVLVDVLAVGICGTDADIIAGDYGQAPPGEDRLILGHESLGRVVDAPAGCGVSTDDLVVCIVRRPDPVPCANCAHGQWDMCRNGRYTEHGIKGLHGFMVERYREEPGRLVRVDASVGLAAVLLEPASIVAKAWDEIDRIASRAAYRPKVTLITGAGPIGLLASLLGVQRGMEVHVLDRVTEGPKPCLVKDLGATYHTQPVEDLDLEPDVVVECTGAPQVVLPAVGITAVDGITCLTGISSAGRSISVDIGSLNRELVLQNDVVFGSVNANRAHYEAAAEALVAADKSWLDRLITRRIPIDRYQDAFDRAPDDVKVVIEPGATP